MINLSKHLILFTGMVLLVSCGGSKKNLTPKETFTKMVEAVDAKDWEYVADGMYLHDVEVMQEMVKSQIANAEKMLAAFGGAGGEKAKKSMAEMKVLLKKEPRDFMLALMKKSEKDDSKKDDFLSGSEVLSEKIDGDKATLTVKDKKGDEDTIQMIKEDGKWYVRLKDKMGKKK